MHQPCSGQPGSGTAPAACVASLLNPHCEQAPRRESLPEVTPLSSEAGTGAVSSDERRAPSWGDREGDTVGKEPGFLGPSDGVCSQEGDGFSLASTSHPSPASPPWSQASQAPPSHSSMACCETLEKPLSPLCPVSPSGKLVPITALGQSVRGSPEPPHGCWEPRRVPTPGRSESSRD